MRRGQFTGQRLGVLRHGASLGNPPATAGALRLQNGQWVPIVGEFSLTNFALTHVPHTALMFAAGDSNQGGVILARR